MRHCIYIATLLLWTTFSFGQTVQRQDGETAEQFAKQFIPNNSVFCHKVIEDNFGDIENGKNIIAFYRDSTNRTSDVLGFGLLRVDTLNNYIKVLIADSLQASMASSSRILAVGFANADSDNEKEIIVAIGQDIRLFDDSGEHSNGIGEFAYTSVYDSKPKEDNGTFYLLSLFNFEGECFDISDTKKKLKGLGY